MSDSSHWPDRADDDYRDWQYEVANGDTLRGFAEWRDLQDDIGDEIADRTNPPERIEEDHDD